LTDFGYLYFNVFVFGIVFGWALFSYEMLSRGVVDLLTALFGPMPPAPLPTLVSRSILTVLLFLAYELGYWLNHYLSHRIPFLWEFHKVHHTATVLTPLTNFRVHPVYMCIFLNILAVFTGLAGGIGEYLLGATTHQYGLSENNIILVFFIYVYVHLQHSQVWIVFRGWLGRLFMSPAHHQIHHSNDPTHFNKNLGSCLALWDWMFGTLHVPSAEREVKGFGVDADRADAHTLWGELIAPFGNAGLRLKEFLGRAPRPTPLPAPDQPRA
jgi:sterol desaturase/sphingolipid hydroxylase (fatty acid hydroxylase superfamily)